MTSSEDRLNGEVRERISGLSDERLLAMIDSGSGDYTPFALSVAQQELSSRGGREVVEDRIAQLDTPAPGTSSNLREITLPGEEVGPVYDVYQRDDYAGF